MLADNRSPETLAIPVQLVVAAMGAGADATTGVSQAAVMASISDAFLL